MNEQTSISTLQPNTHYYVQNRNGLLVGALFQEGVLKPLAFFSNEKDQGGLVLTQTLSAAEIQHIHQQPVMLWYELVCNLRQQTTIALLRCRYNPCHSYHNYTSRRGTGQVGV